MGGASKVDWSGRPAAPSEEFRMFVAAVASVTQVVSPWGRRVGGFRTMLYLISKLSCRGELGSHPTAKERRARSRRKLSVDVQSNFAAF